MLSHFSHIWLFVTPQTRSRQASVHGFSRWEFWSGLPCPSPEDLQDSASESSSVVCDSLRLHGLYSPWNSPGQNNRVSSLSLLQGISPTQGLNPGLLHCRWVLYQLNHQRSPGILKWVVYLFSSGSSQPSIEPGSPALQVDSLLAELPGKPLKIA